MGGCGILCLALLLLLVVFVHRRKKRALKRSVFPTLAAEQKASLKKEKRESKRNSKNSIRLEESTNDGASQYRSDDGSHYGKLMASRDSRSDYSSAGGFASNPKTLHSRTSVMGVVDVGSTDYAEMPAASCVGVEVQESDISFLKEIGSGSFGAVYLARWSNKNVAVKSMKTENTNDGELEAEIAVMQKLPAHENVMGLVAYCKSPVYLLMDYMPLGTLSSFMKSKGLNEKEKRTIAIGIAQGMTHLHEYGIVHRDLAARNVLLDASLQPKVADFGLSRVVMGKSDDYGRQATSKNDGPLKWMAPECLTDNVYSKKTDVWAYGITRK